jgi:hypothetical protein
VGLKSHERQWQDMEEQIDTQFQFLLGMLVDLASDQKEFNQAVTTVKQQFESRKISVYEKIWPILEAQVNTLIGNRRRVSDAERDQWLYQLDETRKQREERFNFKH